VPVAHDAMTLLALTPFTPQASESSDRLVGTSARSGIQGAFSQTLSQVTQPGEVVTVRAGDTLSGLIQKRLQTSHASLQLSGDQLYRVALKVAADNGIPNANLIYPEQRIDLSSASTLAMAEVLQPDTPNTAWAGRGANPTAPASRVAAASDGPASTGAKAFLAQHAQAARQAQASSGIPATFMVAQAALETGWGKHEIRFDDGRTSHNLFGIRAGANWKGPVAEIWTTEFINGAAQKVRGQFRAYGSYQESFNDYARLISQSPRYANAMRNLGDPQAFASALQQAGYATAPNYAQVLSSVIQTTQRMQESVPALASTPLPTTAQVLGLRGGGALAKDAGLSALNMLPGAAALPVVGSRQWRQSPYAELGTPKVLP
jgi:flagellar rod assembly protein/muramidase FlgJ